MKVFFKIRCITSMTKSVPTLYIVIYVLSVGFHRNYVRFKAWTAGILKAVSLHHFILQLDIIGYLLLNIFSSMELMCMQKIRGKYSNLSYIFMAIVTDGICQLLTIASWYASCLSSDAYLFSGTGQLQWRSVKLFRISRKTFLRYLGVEC